MSLKRINKELSDLGRYVFLVNGSVKKTIRKELVVVQNGESNQTEPYETK